MENVVADGLIPLRVMQIQKGVVQLAKALAFLHNQAKVVHLNVTPDSILLNATVRPY
jgi:SCY1-like protein 2